MNATQMKYAKERAKDLYNARRIEIDNRYRPEALGLDACLEAIKSGDFTLKEPEGYGKQTWYNWVSFNRAPTPDKKAQAKEQEDLKAGYVRLIDELVLGDNEKALQLLKAFAEGS